MASGISNRFVSSVVYAWVLTGCLAAGCNHAAESPVAPSVPGAPVDATRWTVTGAVTGALAAFIVAKLYRQGTRLDRLITGIF